MSLSRFPCLLYAGTEGFVSICLKITSDQGYGTGYETLLM